MRMNMKMRFSIFAQHRNKIGILLLSILLIFFTLILIRNAWVCDDAYITFRTVKHIVDGYGPNWNVDQRVQTYTHPLWMFLHCLVYLFTREAFYTSIVISVSVSLAALLLFSFGLARSITAAALGILTASFSKAFIDFGTSGLENPFIHLLSALFLFIYFKSRDDLRTVALLSLLTALIATCRMDAILLFIPVLAYTLWKRRSWRMLSVALIGFSPFVAWEAFSVVYYGFPFPNTAYSKLNTGLPWNDLVAQGLFYIRNSLLVDPLTLTVICGSVVVSILGRRKKEILVASGIALYLLYVIRIGGDFMSGRFLTMPFYCALIVLAQYRLYRRKWIVPAAIVAILLLGLTPAFSPVYTTSGYGGETDRYKFDHGIVDEKGWYFQTSSLLNIHRQKDMPAHRYADWGRNISSPDVFVLIIGYFGYYAPDSTHIVDVYALSDPLLARLPIYDRNDWRIGHFKRGVPEGYSETIATGKNMIRHPGLAEYYRKLESITRGKIFSWQRFMTIIRMNLGMYEHLIANYWK